MSHYENNHEIISFTELIRLGYDAIHLTERGQEAARILTTDRTLYGRDCETVLVLNAASLQTTPNCYQ